MKFLFDHLLLIVLGMVVIYAIFDIYNPSQESDLLTEEPPFKCSTRKYKVLELEAIHKPRVVASFEHRGALLELRENPDPDYGGFSLLWTQHMKPNFPEEDIPSCIIASGRDWTQPPNGDL